MFLFVKIAEFQQLPSVYKIYRISPYLEDNIFTRIYRKKYKRFLNYISFKYALAQSHIEYPD